MKAVYENDRQLGPGYGLFHLTEVDNPSPDVSFALIRSSDQKNLHPQSWENTEYRLKPNNVVITGNELYLAVGPNIVSRLDELNTYRFVLFPASGGSSKALLELSGIIYPPEETMGLVNGDRAADPKPCPAPPAPQEAKAVPEAPPILEPDSPPAPLPAPAQKKSLLPIIIALVVGLILLGAAAFFFLGDTNKNATPEPQPQAAATPEPAEKTPTEPEEKASGQLMPPTTKEEKHMEPAAELSPLEKARQFLRTNGSAEDAMTLAHSLTNSPEGFDAFFLLCDYAAEKDNPEAMFFMGTLYDPNLTLERGSIKSDPEQAWQWYAKSEALGNSTAADAKKALLLWLEQEAGNGNAEANRVLMLVK